MTPNQMFTKVVMNLAGNRVELDVREPDELTVMKNRKSLWDAWQKEFQLLVEKYDKQFCGTCNTRNTCAAIKSCVQYKRHRGTL